ncbi:helix-turn-helix transcriptional regulator [Sphingopyxis sp.]|uniref:helix-turn-helix domain-containing protein n=1 Tax=Sphingopyxis sp. TaxID=1908224 RepID=UPI0026234B19|nr:helix-turn-helix transcriptional regulator [Sphingopyxis sp.]MCW0197385.1 helix-turn-helix transcriptional regulator [Sphingopyxis sp.]
MTDNRESGGGTALDQLTSGERACLELVAEHLQSKEIARKLGISRHTVDARLKAACAKLGTTSRFVAARMLSGAPLEAPDVTVTPANTNLTYERSELPRPDSDAKREASTGQGDGPGDLKQKDSIEPVSHRDSGSGRSWLEPSHPLAKFLGAENQLSIGRRLFYIFAIAIGTAIAFGALVNGLAGISRMFSSP